MKTTIEASIKVLAHLGGTTSKACDALQFTQAALNLAHVLATLDNLKSKE